MVCNKEEALRAKILAEEKMKAGDFVGAHKLVTKAQRLFPNLENIQQMIAICDVHSSANAKMDDKNWYGILQVEPFADADTIKKQYRKLTLLLHPDKNKFAGAESAFKLVGEANMVLSDKIQRSVYDLTYRSQKSYTYGDAAKKRSFSEVYGFDVDINEHRRRAEEMPKRVEEAANYKLCGWASSSTAVKKESQDKEPETGEAKKRGFKEDRQKWFEEPTRGSAASSSTAVKIESQDQKPVFPSPFASMHSNTNSENVDRFWRKPYIPCNLRNYLVPPSSISTHRQKDQEEAKLKPSFDELYGFDVHIIEHRRRRLERIEAERQKRREEFGNKYGSSVAGKKESQDQEPETKLGEAKKMTSFKAISERMQEMKNKYVKPDYIDAAVRKLANLWKGRIRIENPRSSHNVLAFLHFIVAHKLHNSIINQEETTKLASSIAHHKEAPTLFQSLGLNNKIPEFVEELISTRQYIPAVRLICFFKLKDFSPLHLLKKEMESKLAQDKDGGKLRDILELLADYKLQIDIPRELIVKLMYNQNQVQPLTDQVENIKAELESTTNELRCTTGKLDEEKNRLQSLERKAKGLEAELHDMREEEVVVRKSIEDEKIALKKIQEDINDTRRSRDRLARKLRDEVDDLQEACESIYHICKQF